MPNANCCSEYGRRVCAPSPIVRVSCLLLVLILKIEILFNSVAESPFVRCMLSLKFLHRQKILCSQGILRLSYTVYYRIRYFQCTYIMIT